MSRNNHIFILFSPPSNGKKFNHDAGGGVGTVIGDLDAKIFPPLAALYSASILRCLRYEVYLVDSNAKSLSVQESLATINDQSSVQANGFDIVLFGSLVSLPNDLQYISVLNEEYPASRILYASTVGHLFFEKIIESGASGVISGDIEASIEEAVHNASGEKKLFRKFLSAKEQNSFPKPAWDLISLDHYTSYTILGSRGCNYGCPHCPYHVYQRSMFVGRSANSVIKEIGWLKSVFDPDYFLFRDPCFSYNIARAEAIAKGITECFGSSLEWGCETRPERITKKLIKTFSEAGCHHIRMGIESTTSSIIEGVRNVSSEFNSNSYLKHASSVIEWCREYDIKSVCFFIVGFSNDSASTIRQIKDFVSSADPDVALASYLIPYPDTFHTKALIESGTPIPDDWSIYGSKDEPILPTTYLSLDELKQEKINLDRYFARRNRQFYPIR